MTIIKIDTHSITDTSNRIKDQPTDKNQQHVKQTLKQVMKYNYKYSTHYAEETGVGYLIIVIPLLKEWAEEDNKNLTEETP